MDLKQLLSKRQQQFIEDRLIVSQWCEKLVEAYSAMSEDIRAQLPPLPATTPQEMLPSLFAEEFDKEQYAKEAAVLQDIQAKMTALAMRMNEEALKCLSE